MNVSAEKRSHLGVCPKLTAYLTLQFPNRHIYQRKEIFLYGIKIL